MKTEQKMERQLMEMLQDNVVTDGVIGKLFVASLYKINNNDYTNPTFVITTPETDIMFTSDMVEKIDGDEIIIKED